MGADYDETTQENEPLKAPEGREHSRRVGKRVSLEQVDRQREKCAKRMPVPTTGMLPYRSKRPHRLGTMM